MRIINFLLLVVLSTPAWSAPISVGETVTLNSKVFDQARVIRVSLPESYDANLTARYPVIYVVRGQLEHIITLASLELLDQEIPQFIVVGVDGRGGEFFPSKDDSQSAYSRFLHQEVVPNIEKNYRVAQFNVLLGHSNAGRFVANDWIDRGKDFSAYISISPSMGDGYINGRAKALESNELDTKSSLLITLANEQRGMIEPFEELGEVFSQQKNISFAKFPKQTHMSVRSNAIMHGLRSVFPDWQAPRDIQQGMLAPLLEHYTNLSKSYGFEVAVPQDILNRMAAFHSWNEDAVLNANAADVVEYVISRNSDDADEMFDMVQQLADRNAVEGSKRLISYICRWVKNDERCAI